MATHSATVTARRGPRPGRGMARRTAVGPQASCCANALEACVQREPVAAGAPGGAELALHPPGREDAPGPRVTGIKPRPAEGGAARTDLATIGTAAAAPHDHAQLRLSLSRQRPGDRGRTPDGRVRDDLAGTLRARGHPARRHAGSCEGRAAHQRRQRNSRRLTGQQAGAAVRHGPMWRAGLRPLRVRVLTAGEDRLGRTCS
jgi:hypothetical protein